MKAMKFYALPADQDASLFDASIFEKHKDMTPQQVADLANAVVAGILSVGERNTQELYKLITTGKLFGNPS